MDVLDGLTIVEHATEISGPYCTKLFADVGATVVKVESMAGDPLRHHKPDDAAGHDGALFRFLNAGKQAVVLAPEDAEFTALLSGADLFVDSAPVGTVDHAALLRQFPSLVVLVISPYGATGPYRNRPATPFVVEAESGAMSTRGRADQPPVQAGGRIFEWLAGAYAAVAALAAVRRARSTGEGELVDCALLEVCHTGGSGGAQLMWQLAGKPPITEPARRVELPSIEPTADGWIGVNTNTRQQFESFLLMIERTDLFEHDETWASADTRWKRMEEWNAIVHAWTREHTTADIIERASLLRIPVAPVNNGRTVLDHPHFAARGIWTTSPDGAFTHPLPPYQIDGVRPRPRGPAPALGANQDATAALPLAARPARPPARSAGTRPLAGIRIIDATAWWAGPSSTQTLGALGADVIHVESTKNPDGGRMVTRQFGHPDWWERSFLFLRSNTDKRDMTIDLSTPRGRDILRLLVESADIIVENFSPRVFDNFGLTWDELHTINPALIMVRMPAFGLDGPWRDNVGFAQTMEQVTGMAWVTGHASDQPRIPRGPCDPMAGMSAAYTMLLGLERRDRTGHGSFIEVAMVESALNAAAEQVIHYTAYGEILNRDGNRSREAAPQGLYACRGDDEWLALSITDDVQWCALKEILGNPSWAADPRLDTLAGRRAEHDMIDERLSSWAAPLDVAETAGALIARGIPAGRLWDARRCADHPQMAARGFFEPLDHPVVGRHSVMRPPFRFASIERWTESPAPTLGQHNEEILAELGCDNATIAELIALGVIGTRPQGIDG